MPGQPGPVGDRVRIHFPQFWREIVAKGWPECRWEICEEARQQVARIVVGDGLGRNPIRNGRIAQAELRGAASRTGVSGVSQVVEEDDGGAGKATEAVVVGSAIP